MPGAELTLLAAHIRRMAATGAEALTDAELVGRYAESRDAAAFEFLVWRHRPMVGPHAAESSGAITTSRTPSRLHSSR